MDPVERADGADGSLSPGSNLLYLHYLVTTVELLICCVINWRYMTRVVLLMKESATVSANGSNTLHAMYLRTKGMRDFLIQQVGDWRGEFLG